MESVVLHGYCVTVGFGGGVSDICGCGSNINNYWTIGQLDNIKLQPNQERYVTYYRYGILVIPHKWYFWYQLMIHQFTRYFR
jgi:hypothetical protein